MNGCNKMISAKYQVPFLRKCTKHTLATIQINNVLYFLIVLLMLWYVLPYVQQPYGSIRFTLH